MKMFKLLSIATLAMFAIAALPVLAQDAAKPPVTKNLKIMLTADAGLTKDASGKVTDWTSQVEPKVKFAQEYAEKQPSLAKDSVNGKPAVSFDGEQDSLITAELPKDFVGDVTVFVVWASAVEQKHQGQDGVNNLILSATTVKGSDWETGFQLTTGSKAVTKPGITTGSYTARPQLKYLGIGEMINPENGTGTGFTMTGDVAEVLLYNEKLSDADTAAVTKYLQAKYKIAQ